VVGRCRRPGPAAAARACFWPPRRLACALAVPGAADARARPPAATPGTVRAAGSRALAAPSCARADRERHEISLHAGGSHGSGGRWGSLCCYTPCRTRVRHGLGGCARTRGGGGVGDGVGGVTRGGGGGGGRPGGARRPAARGRKRGCAAWCARRRRWPSARGGAGPPRRSDTRGHQTGGRRGAKKSGTPRGALFAPACRAEFGLRSLSLGARGGGRAARGAAACGTGHWRGAPHTPRARRARRKSISHHACTPCCMQIQSPGGRGAAGGRAGARALSCWGCRGGLRGSRRSGGAPWPAVQPRGCAGRRLRRPPSTSAAAAGCRAAAARLPRQARVHPCHCLGQDRLVAGLLGQDVPEGVDQAQRLVLDLRGGGGEGGTEKGRGRAGFMRGRGGQRGAAGPCCRGARQPAAAGGGSGRAAAQRRPRGAPWRAR
jgi:hypothetical protein